MEGQVQTKPRRPDCSSGEGLEVFIPLVALCCEDGQLLPQREMTLLLRTCQSPVGGSDEYSPPKPSLRLKLQPSG